MKTDTIIKQLSNPWFLFCFIPGFYVLFGTLYARQYTEINWLSFGILYLFLLLNQILERLLQNIDRKKERTSLLSLGIIESCVLIMIIYFGLSYSIFTAALMLCYSIMIQTQYMFRYYELSWLAIILVTLFKGLLANSLSFYIHAGFIPMQILIWVSPLFLPLFFLEWTRWHLPLTKKHISYQLIGIYLMGVFLMWWVANMYAIILLISLPFACILWIKVDRKLIPLFVASFLLSHFFTSLISFLNLR